MEVKVGILGVGRTKHAVQPDKSLRDLLVEAGNAALDDAGLGPKYIDMLVVGNVMGLGLVGENTIGPMAADHLGLCPVGAATIESACSTGAWALHVGVVAVLSGMYDTVLVVGGEKMNDITTEIATGYIAGGADAKEEYFTGMTFPAGVAMTARKYMLEYGCTERDLAHTSHKNHHYGARNPFAHLRFESSVDECLQAPLVADPLRLFDVCPMTDAASAMVVSRPELMKNATAKEPVYITGSATGTGGFYATSDSLLDAYLYIKRPADKVYEQSGLGPEDIHLAEVYNAFSIQEPLGLESVGFCEMGEGWELAVDGVTWHEGRWPTNLSGGLLCKGHPLGATGLTQVIDLVDQLWGRFKGVNAVNDPVNALAVCRGGPGATSAAHIIQKL